MLSAAGLTPALEAELETGRTVALLVLRLPEFAERAWREGKRAAQRLERLSAAAFREAAERMIRDGDAFGHEPGSDWFAVALLAPGRDGSFSSVLDARAALERIAAAISLTTGLRMETGWWPLSSPVEARDLARTVERALERGAKERERYEFLATVGHELRTPLTSIRGYIETLLDDDVDAATARTFLETARREALRLGRLVDGMLEFSLLDLSARALPASATDVGEQIVSAIEALQPIARSRNIELRHHVDPGTRARIEPDACMHALLNLIENAIKYGRDGGSVVVSSNRRDPFLDIIVDDDGPGVPGSERDSIFQLRARGLDAAARPGSGIGLAIVKAIAERIAGATWVESSPLGGARFVLRVPVFGASRAELERPLS